MERNLKEKEWTFFNSFQDVFSFFFLLGRKAKKTKVFYLLSFMPVAMALMVQFGQIFYSRNSLSGPYVFSNIIITFYLQFIILILALFFGTSVCSEELEGKTLSYLTTRPISKSSFILGKYAAYSLLMVLMTVVGVVLCFLILNFNQLGRFSLYKVLLKDTAVLVLGLLCYTALFTFIGTFIKRSIMFGLIFSFGWENVIQYFPGSTQRFAIVHYLKSLLPSPTSGRFSFLLFRLEPTPPVLAVVILLGITALFLGLACLVFSYKEYILEE
ncbi:MAG: ABC transporter permease subunit [Candidatus Aminicenantes bacterium]|nr:ABC transporter permease subunit [Candidatus Aminicenantes bacterium]